jgi:hypothetical protein
MDKSDDSEEPSGRPAIYSERRFLREKKKRERQRFTITRLSCDFPQITRNFLNKIAVIYLGYHKIASENAYDSTQNSEIGFDF